MHVTVKRAQEKNRCANVQYLLLYMKEHILLCIHSMLKLFSSYE